MPIRYLEHLTHIPCRIKVLWGVNPRFHGLYPGIGQVAYALLTRAPVAIKVLLPHDAPDLHVLSLSLAFILSQDQTLHSNKNFKNYLFRSVIISVESLLGLALAVCFQTFQYL